MQARQARWWWRNHLFGVDLFVPLVGVDGHHDWAHASVYFVSQEACAQTEHSTGSECRESEAIEKVHVGAWCGLRVEQGHFRKVAQVQDVFHA